MSLRIVRRRVLATQSRSITSPRSGFSSSSQSKLPSYSLPSWQSPSQNFQQRPVMFLMTSILCANSCCSLIQMSGYCMICSPMLLFSSMRMQGASLQSTCTSHIDFCCTTLLLRNFSQLWQKRLVSSVLKSNLCSVPLMAAEDSLLLITQKSQYLSYLACRIFILVPTFTAPPIITAFFRGASGIQAQSFILTDLDSLTRASMQASTLLMGRSKSSWQSSSSPRCTLYSPGKIWNLQGTKPFMSDCCQTSILPNLTMLWCCSTASSQNLAKKWQYSLVLSYTSTIQMSSESPSKCWQFSALRVSEAERIWLMQPLFWSQCSLFSGLPSTSQACMICQNFYLQVWQLGFLSGWYFSTSFLYCDFSSSSLMPLEVSSTSQQLTSLLSLNLESLTQMSFWYCSAPRTTKRMASVQKMSLVSPPLFLLDYSTFQSCSSCLSYSSRFSFYSSFYFYSSFFLALFFSRFPFSFSSFSFFSFASLRSNYACSSAVSTTFGSSFRTGYFWLSSRCSLLKSKVKISLFGFWQSSAASTSSYCLSQWLRSVAHLDFFSALSIYSSSQNLRLFLRGGMILLHATNRPKYINNPNKQRRPPPSKLHLFMAILPIA